MYLLLKRNDMNYKGFTLEEETDTNAMRLGSRYKFFRGTSYYGQVINMASTLDEAVSMIDDMTCNDVDQVASLIKGLGHTLGAARASRDTLKNLGIQSDLLDATISENENLLKQLE